MLEKEEEGDHFLTRLRNCCHINWLGFSPSVGVLSSQGYFLKEKNRGGIVGDILHVLSFGLDFNFLYTGCRTFLMIKGK